MSKEYEQQMNSTDGDDVMTMETYNRKHSEYLSAIENYIEDLKSKEPVKAKEEAKDSLYRSGVITKKGTLKKNIVTR